jgi:hypothetical protein
MEMKCSAGGFGPLFYNPKIDKNCQDLDFFRDISGGKNWDKKVPTGGGFFN